MWLWPLWNFLVSCARSPRRRVQRRVWRGLWRLPHHWWLAFPQEHPLQPSCPPRLHVSGLPSYVCRKAPHQLPQPHAHSHERGESATEHLMCESMDIRGFPFNLLTIWWTLKPSYVLQKKTHPSIWGASLHLEVEEENTERPCWEGYDS